MANLLPGHRDNATSRPDRPLPRSDRPDPTLGFEGTAAFDPTLSRADVPLSASFRRWTASTQRPTWVSSNRSEGRASPRDWTVAAVFEDAGISGAKGRDARPAYDALLKAVTRHEVDLVASWSVDRLGRSLVDLLGFLAASYGKNCWKLSARLPIANSWRRVGSFRTVSITAN